VRTGHPQSPAKTFKTSTSNFPVPRSTFRKTGPDAKIESDFFQDFPVCATGSTHSVAIYIRQMQPIFSEQDMGQKSRSGAPPRDRMRGRRRLRDRLATAAGELLAHVLDYFPLARDEFQRLGHILAKRVQSPAAARARRGRWIDDALARGAAVGLAGPPTPDAPPRETSRPSRAAWHEAKGPPGYPPRWRPRP
jgi:hypothetical protein